MSRGGNLPSLPNPHSRPRGGGGISRGIVLGGGPQTLGSIRAELLCHGRAPQISPSSRTQGVPLGPRCNRVWGVCPDSAASPTLADPTLQLVAPSPSP